MEGANTGTAGGEGPCSDDLLNRPRKKNPVPPVSQRIKVISCGDYAVGKSCLIKRFCEKRFVSAHIPTVGVDFGVANIKIKNAPVKVNYYDLAGPDAYADVRCEFVADTGGILLVFDVTDRPSFSHLDKWVREIKAADPRLLDQASVVCCGNKCDLLERAVPEAEARLWCESRGMYYFETSAKDGTNVQAAFDQLHSLSLTAAEGSLAAPPPRPSFTQSDIDAIARVMKASTDAERLGVSHRASKEQITKAYRGLATALHPDKNRAPGAEEAFKHITQARVSLISTAKK
eukprot:m.100490 g.100490  ORF g.100490 m.100490 type:complete len:289 (-) comp10351_c0_seq2:1857-2723(-)